ncbi:unnamed protein product [Owenia fusiformis]|uniref:F-box/LRR-repeat protein 8 n=1 Tax=Owenia fusiformis TaxID=6347 RepID=A0A8J1TTK9_OWEFU|nr:unnamed protein product [Owenia fusiformis]
MDSLDWSHLPEHVIVEIFRYLSLGQRFYTSLVCKTWQTSFQMPYLWRQFDFKLKTQDDLRLLSCIPLYGRHIQSVYIELDQSVDELREAGVKVITDLARLSPRRLQYLTLKFTGENPLFYAGKEYTDALHVLFSPYSSNVDDDIQYRGLISVDISKLYVALDDKLINILSTYNKDIERVNIQNRNLICRVSPTCLLRLVTRCRKLKELCVYNSSMSEDVLLALTESDRSPLQHLSIIYRREEKYLKHISDDSWIDLVKVLPGLRVTLGFDHTIELANIKHKLNPHIPVSVLRLDTFTRIYDEINIAASYYGNTLEKLVVQTTESDELNSAVLNLVENCPNLKSLHVFCVLEKSIIDRIFELRPVLREKNTFTLKHIKEPHPWVAGNDCFGM